MRRGLAGLLGLPESLFDHSGKGSSPMPAADYLGQQDDQQQQQAAPGGLRRHGSGIPLPPPPPLDASLVRSLSGVPCPPSPTKPPAADGLARQFSGLPLAAALAEAAAGPKTRKRARTARPRQAATAAAAAAVAEEADEPMDEAEQKRHARLMKNRQTAAASRQRRLDRIAFLEARCTLLEEVLGLYGIPVPEPLEGPKAAAPPPGPVLLHRGTSLPANFSLAAAAAAGPLARQASLPLNCGAGFGMPLFELPGSAPAATALFTPPSQAQQPPLPVPGAPTVPAIRQAPILVPHPAQLDLPSRASGALPGLTLAPASASASLLAGAPAVPQPLPQPQPAEAARRAAAAAAAVAAMPPEQKAVFLTRLRELHPDVLPVLAAQRREQLQAGGATVAAGVAASAAAALLDMPRVPVVKQEAAEAAPPLQLPTSDRAAGKLEQLVEDAARLLNELTGISAAEGETARPPAMPLTAITHAQALAFVFRRKAGALLSVVSERAFLVTRQGSEGGGMQWSAPVFCRGWFLSAGLTAGWMDLRMCLAIRSQQGQEEILRPYCAFCGLNAQFLLDMNGPRVRQLHTSSGSSSMTSQVDLKHAAKYFTLDAGMIDLSIRAGRFTLDRPLNEAVYGRGVAVEDILAGRLAPPVEFGPFYSLLDNYVRAAMRSPSMARLTLAAGSGRSPRLPSQLGAVSARGLAMQAGGLGSGDTSPPAPGGSPGRSSPPVSAASARTEASSGVDLQAIEEDAAAEASAVRRQTLDFSLA